MRFIATLVGFGAVGSAIAWSPWFFVLAIVAMSWVLIDSAYRIHASVPTGNVLARARKIIRQLAATAEELANSDGTTFQAIFIWYDGAEKSLRSIGPHLADQFKRDCHRHEIEQAEANPVMSGHGAKAVCRQAVKQLETMADILTPYDISPEFDVYSGD